LIHCGDTFLIDPPGFGHDYKAHLWIVLTEPDRPHGECLAVHFSTLRNQVDQTVIVQRGDHSFVNRPSYVCYRRIRIVRTAVLETWVEDGRAEIRERVTERLLKLIQDGILASEWTPYKVRSFYEAYLSRHRSGPNSDCGGRQSRILELRWRG